MHLETKMGNGHHSISVHQIRDCPQYITQGLCEVQSTYHHSGAYFSFLFDGLLIKDQRYSLFLFHFVQ